ncbi:MAG: mannose-6-phosphate isomerase, class I [Euzebya sp.]
MERLVGVVRNYDWGDDTFIPQLLGRPVDGSPYAELWFGAHRSDPSGLAGSALTLADAIEQDPVGVVGDAESGFPFLAKVLAAAAPLSIQVHPGASAARQGYAAENAAGIELDAPNRTYRDPFPKPELVCAVRPLSAKCGLRDVPATLDLLTALQVEPLEGLRRILAAGPSPSASLGAALRHLFGLSSSQAADLVQAVVRAAGRLDLPRWAHELDWTVRLARHFPHDIGVVVALLLNHVELAPGDAMYLGAGNMHSYLRGVAVEVMGPSDNVIRGGLTAKHIDTAELLRQVDTTPITPDVQSAAGPVHAYRIDRDAFGLARIDLTHSGPIRLWGPGVVVLAGNGQANLIAEDSSTGEDRPGSPPLVISGGQAGLVRADDGMVRVSGSGVVHWAHGGGWTYETARR